MQNPNQPFHSLALTQLIANCSPKTQPTPNQTSADLCPQLIPASHPHVISPKIKSSTTLILLDIFLTVKGAVELNYIIDIYTKLNHDFSYSLIELKISVNLLHKINNLRLKIGDKMGNVNNSVNNCSRNSLNVLTQTNNSEQFSINNVSTTCPVNPYQTNQNSISFEENKKPLTERTVTNFFPQENEKNNDDEKLESNLTQNNDNKNETSTDTDFNSSTNNSNDQKSINPLAADAIEIKGNGKSEKLVRKLFSKGIGECGASAIEIEEAKEKVINAKKYGHISKNKANQLLEKLDKLHLTCGQNHFLSCFTGCPELNHQTLEFENNTNPKHNFFKHYSSESPNQRAFDTFFSHFISLSQEAREKILSNASISQETQNHINYLLDDKNITEPADFFRKVTQSKKEIEESELPILQKIWNNSGFIFSKLIQIIGFQTAINAATKTITETTCNIIETASEVTTTISNNFPTNLPTANAMPSIFNGNNQPNTPPATITHTEVNTVSTENLDIKTVTESNEQNQSLINYYCELPKQNFNPKTQCSSENKILTFPKGYNSKEDTELFEQAIKNQIWDTCVEMLKNGYIDDSENPVLEQAIAKGAYYSLICDLDPYSTIREEKKKAIFQQLIYQREWSSIVQLLKTKHLTDNPENPVIEKAIAKGAYYSLICDLALYSTIREEKKKAIFQQLIDQEKWKLIVQLLKTKQLTDNPENPVIEKAIAKRADYSLICDLAPYSTIREEKKKAIFQQLINQREWSSIVQLLKNKQLTDDPKNPVLEQAIGEEASNEDIGELAPYSTIREEKNNEILQQLIDQEKWKLIVQLLKTKQLTDNPENPVIEKAIAKGAYVWNLRDLAPYSTIREEKKKAIFQQLIDQEKWKLIVQLLKTKQLTDNPENPAIEQAIEKGVVIYPLIDLAQYSTIREEKNNEILQQLIDQNKWESIILLLNMKKLKDDPENPILEQAIVKGASNEDIGELAPYYTIREEKNNEILQQLIDQKNWNAIVLLTQANSLSLQDQDTDLLIKLAILDKTDEQTILSILKYTKPIKDSNAILNAIKEKQWDELEKLLKQQIIVNEKIKTSEDVKKYANTLEIIQLISLDLIQKSTGLLEFYLSSDNPKKFEIASELLKKGCKLESNKPITILVDLRNKKVSNLNYRSQSIQILKNAGIIIFKPIILKDIKAFKSTEKKSTGVSKGGIYTDTEGNKYLIKSAQEVKDLKIKGTAAYREFLSAKLYSYLAKTMNMLGKFSDVEIVSDENDEYMILTPLIPQFRNLKDYVVKELGGKDTNLDHSSFKTIDLSKCIPYGCQLNNKKVLQLEKKDNEMPATTVDGKLISNFEELVLLLEFLNETDDHGRNLGIVSDENGIYASKVDHTCSLSHLNQEITLNSIKKRIDERFSESENWSDNKIILALEKLANIDVKELESAIENIFDENKEVLSMLTDYIIFINPNSQELENEISKGRIKKLLLQRHQQIQTIVKTYKETNN